MKTSILAAARACTFLPQRIIFGAPLNTSKPLVLFDVPSLSNAEDSVSVANKASKNKLWKAPRELEPNRELIEIAGSSVLASLLLARGIETPEQARTFLDPAYYTPSSPMEFADMPAAIMRIGKAIALQEKITVYGDYDVDGVTATSVMLTVLRKLGANVDFYIPNRSTEGYGLNLKAVSILASKHRTRLIISCDCGISNFAEINLAKQLGVDTIIADHHSMPELLPPAVAILHPKQFHEQHPLFHLPGVGVAYKLSEALLQDNGMHEEVAKLHDFVTLGMIADMVPLVSENRYLVQIGLPALAASPRAGIRALLDQTVKMDGTDLVGFGLAPRINAVGRLSDANLAVQLMTTDNQAEAEKLAKQLDTENLRRQELCEQVFFEADQKAKNILAQREDLGLAIYSPGWHHGVVGIVASRLVEKYHVPVFIAELDEAEGKIKGSARGIPGIDLYQVLKENEHLMLKWGGHQAAAGFSTDADKADALCASLVNTCNRMLAAKSIVPKLDIELVLPPESVDLSLAKEVGKLGPFGMGNKKPVIALTGMFVVNTRPLGKEGKHHRIVVRDTGKGGLLECVFWRSSGRVPEIGASIDVAFCPESNFFNNTERLQLVLSDWRPASPLVYTPETEEPAQPLVASAPASVAGPTLVLPQLAIDGPAEKAEITLSQPTAVSDSARTTDAANRFASLEMNWKDLRNHASPRSVVEAALRRFGEKLTIFTETSDTFEGATVHDRTSIEQCAHLLIWQFPPSMQDLQSIIQTARPSNIYIVGGAPNEVLEAGAFLKKLLAVARFAVNQREGEANADKLASVLNTTKLAVALGLTVLKKVNVIDWYAEEGTIYLDLLGAPDKPWDSLPEYAQLVNVLAEITEFRRWCAERALKDIQLALVPNAIKVDPSGQLETMETVDSTFGRADYGRASNILSGN